MITLFKNIGRGILYIFVLPLLLVALAVYAVVAIFIFIYLAIKGLVLFFSGRSLYEDLPEDIEAKKRLGGKPSVQPMSLASDPLGYPSNDTATSTDPFYVPEYLKPNDEHVEEVVEENRIEPEPEYQPEVSININREEEIKEEIPQKSVQKRDIYEDLDEDDDSDSGIHINYD